MNTRWAGCRAGALLFALAAIAAQGCAPATEIPAPYRAASAALSCGAVGLVCCPGVDGGPGQCAAGVCADGNCVAPTMDCGREGQPCCAGSGCVVGARCVAGACVRAACGAPEGPCCAEAPRCGAGHVCGGDGRCAPRPADCGRGGQPCCDADPPCARRFTCVNGTCERR